jgi:glycine oxidase
MSASSIVVAGAGAIGRTIAYVLARSGHRVVVVDPDPRGGAASRVAAGMLAPAFESLFDEGGRFALLAAARDLWTPLAGEIGLELDRQGALAVGSRQAAEGWAAGLEREGAAGRLLDPSRVEAFGARVGAWAAFSSDDWRLDPALALAALRRAAQERGARFVDGHVRGFAGGVASLEDGGTLVAEWLVLASGYTPGLPRLAPELDLLTPVKGQILRARGDFAPGPVLRAPGVYLSRADGMAILGATMEAGRSDTEIEPGATQRLLEAGATLADGLDRLAWRADAGVRAATPDGLPMVGQGSAPDVIVAVGARRNGWLLAPMIAEVVLAQIEGRPQGEPARLFDPARFAGVSPG